MVQTVCLDESKHATAMLRKLNIMKHDTSLCDFIIKVNDREFHTHKNILSAGSNYFEALFNHDTEETRNGIIVMKEVDEDCVKSCVDFIYTGKFDIPDNKIGSLLHVVIMLQLEDMKIAISGILDQSLCAENFFSTRNIADLYRLKEISGKCKKFYKENLISISLQSDFKTEKKSHISDIIMSRKTGLLEEEKVSICLRWAGDSSENKKYLGKLLNSLDLWKISHGYLNDLLENNPVVCNDFKLYKTLSNPMLKPMTPDQLSVREIEEAAKGEKMKKKKVEKSKALIVLFDESADSLQSYDPISDNITKFHNENFKHLNSFSASILDSYIYILGYKKSVHRLNFQYADSKWEKMPDTLVNHGRTPSQIASDGFLYVVGGFDKNFEAMKDVERFEPKVNRWVAMEDKPDAIAFSALMTLGEFVYSVGGITEKRMDSRALTRYTPRDDHWTKLPSMKEARILCGAVVVGYKIFVMGGMKRSWTLKSLECYDVAAAQWTVLRPMLRRHFILNAYYADGQIFAICQGNSDESEKYDIEQNSWSKITMRGLGRFQISTSLAISS